MTRDPTFRLGVEEEYLLVDCDTLDLVRKPDPRFMTACREQIGERVVNEYLQCQIEVGTQPCLSIPEIRSELSDLRLNIAKIASGFGYAPIAASTHPFANWREQARTPKERYDRLSLDLGMNARRLLICGMHIHVEIEDEDPAD